MPARLQRAKGIYAFAEGPRTVMYYPQLFLVTLRGEPAVIHDFSNMVTGHTSPSAAINATLQYTMDPQTNRRSDCNHHGCIYNQGDLVTRRNRFRQAAAELDQLLRMRSSAKRHDVLAVTKQVTSLQKYSLIQEPEDIPIIDYRTSFRCAPARRKLSLDSWEDVSLSLNVVLWEVSQTCSIYQHLQ